MFRLDFYCVFLDADFCSTVNGTIPAVPPADDENVAFNNAVSGGLLGAVVAAGLVLVRTLKSISWLLNAKLTF